MIGIDVFIIDPCPINCLFRSEIYVAEIQRNIWTFILNLVIGFKLLISTYKRVEKILRKYLICPVGETSQAENQNPF